MPFALGALGVVALLAPPGVAANHTPGVTTLLRQASKLVGARYPTAVLYEADGTTAGGRATSTAAGIVTWRFWFGGFSTRSGIASASVSFGPAPKRFGSVRGYRSPVLEDVPIRKVPKMTLGRAVTDLRHAGYHDAFTGVTLRNPLGPHRSNPLYIFTTTHHGYVTVDTKTGRVAVIR